MSTYRRGAMGHDLATGSDRGLPDQTTDQKAGVGRVPPLKLSELKSRPCSLEELQAALVEMIELYNQQGKVMNDAINRKQDKEWRATL
jgi:hypothetical protein